MKKLTAGILTVMLGIVAANSADASIASKGYVDAQVGAKVSTSDFETFKGTNTTAIEAAKKAGTDASAALETYKTSNDAAVGKKADTETVNAELAKKQDKLVSTDNVVINADNTITLKGIATDTGLADLQNTVGEHTTALGTLNGGADTTGSVANSIANALKDYTTTANMNTALDKKADKTTVADDLAKKQDKLTAGTNITIGTDGTISSTYTYNDADVKADITKNANAISAMDAAYKAADTAIDKKIGTVAEGKTVVEMIDDAKNAASGDTTALTGRVETIEKTGITAEKVAQIETNKTGVAANKTAVEKVAADVASLGTLAKAAPGKCASSTKKCALVFDGTNYTWEVIERDAENQ